MSTEYLREFKHLRRANSCWLLRQGLTVTKHLKQLGIPIIFPETQK